MLLPTEGTHKRRILNALLSKGPQTQARIRELVPLLRKYSNDSLSDSFASMCDSGLIEKTGDVFSLTQYALDLVNGTVPFVGVVASSRIGNVFGREMSPVTGHVAMLRKALMGRLA